jgi:hypothetical protein
MKVTFTPIVGGSLVFNLEANDDVTLFEQLNRVQDVFGDTCCGCCKGTNLRFRVRKAKNQKGNEFSVFERVCLDCKAKLDFGQNREGRTLFPKRGENRDTNGWYVYGERQPVQQRQPAYAYDNHEDDDNPPF